MPSIWAILLTLPAALVAFVDWRKGLFALLVVAFLQDPARKLEPDQPVYFVILVGVVFAAVYLRAQTGSRFKFSQIVGWKQFIRTPFIVFAAVLLVQAVNSIAHYENPIIA